MKKKKTTKNLFNAKSLKKNCWFSFVVYLSPSSITFIHIILTKFLMHTCNFACVRVYAAFLFAYCRWKIEEITRFFSKNWFACRCMYSTELFSAHTHTYTRIHVVCTQSVHKCDFVSHFVVGSGFELFIERMLHFLSVCMWTALASATLFQSMITQTIPSTRYVQIHKNKTAYHMVNQITQFTLLFYENSLGNKTFITHIVE